MRHTCFENSIPLDVCKEIKEFFDSHPELQIHKPNNPDVIKINSPWSHLHEILDPIFSKYFKTNKGQGGNIYKHTNLYSLHVDSDEPWQMINVNIPIHLEVEEPSQQLIVFDQWTDNGFGQTWYGARKDIKKHGDFDRNHKIAMTPWEDERVYDCVDKPIDEDFYSKYLEFNNHTPELFYGLTGTAYDFVPGNMVVFNSNNIHSTGKLIGPWKMGLLIQFEGTVEELLHE
tara:strand:- start:95 stop:784 length:690 start_codon:yes stop_codon:yes gene_type:complete